VTYRWAKKITLAKGTYTWKVYAIDQKHRSQSVLGWNRLIVK
jgi:hypothetical protein